MEEEKTKEPLRLTARTIILIICILLILFTTLCVIIKIQANRITNLNGNLKIANYKYQNIYNQYINTQQTIEQLEKSTFNETSNNEIVDSSIEETNTIENIPDYSSLRKILPFSHVNEKKIYTYKDSKLDYNIIYDGIPISENIGIHSIGIGEDAFENTTENIEKFNQTYYTYHKDGFMRKIDNPTFVTPLLSGSENLLIINNLSDISVSKQYDLMPRAIEYDFEYDDTENENYYDIYKNIQEYYSKNNNLLGNNHSDTARVDLNGDGNYIYINLSIEKVIIDYGEIVTADEMLLGIAFNYDVFDKNGNYITTLLTNLVKYDDVNPDYVSLKESNSITCADLDNDSKMEIIIDAPWYEFGEYIYTYKYENGSFLGEIGAINYISS